MVSIKATNTSQPARKRLSDQGIIFRPPPPPPPTESLATAEQVNGQQRPPETVWMIKQVFHARRHFPVGTWRLYNVSSTLMHSCYDVASTLR